MPEHDPQRYRFACTQCGQCCRWPGDVRLTDGDIRRLAAYQGQEERAWIERHTRLSYRRNALSLLEGTEGACLFLVDDRCSVYEARPEQCRRFPFAETTPAECPGLVPI